MPRISGGEDIASAPPATNEQLFQISSLQTRTISYNYDQLQRLTSAVESGSSTNSYAYAYDRAGNRTSATVNGTTTIRDYNAANQVMDWTYDQVGNLLNDGTQSYTYDALSRLTSRGGTSFAYNGDGTLVARTVGAATTRYSQDLISPLSQVLNDGSANYLYGLDRLAAQAGGTMTWYITDALGSVHQALDNAGAPLASASYDPWGTPQGSMISPFGFTGELQDAQGLTYLRARWYNPASSTFTSRDPFKGFLEQPYSQHPFQYAYSNPVLLSDPTGMFVGEKVELTFSNNTKSADLFVESSVSYSETCLADGSITLNLIDIGYVIGASRAYEAFVYGVYGMEEVWSLLTFERALFDIKMPPEGTPSNTFDGFVLGVGLDLQLYWGGVRGWSNRHINDWNIESYGGNFFMYGVSAQTPLDFVSADVAYVISEDGRMQATTIGLGGGANFWPFAGSHQNGRGSATIRDSSITRYRSGTGAWPTFQDGLRMASDVLNPSYGLFHVIPAHAKAYALYAINHNAREWQKYQDWLATNP